MKTFLQLVAHDIYSKLGNNLSRVAIVFPNKRASLFFNEYLALESQQPIWSPSYHSISELLQSLSDIQIGDDIKLISMLYNVFEKHTESKETLDDFYFWGELLLSDFDDIDKNRVDAENLFTNLKDLKDLVDTYEFLDEEQEAAIQQFFDNFSLEKRTILKDRFISLWDKLGNIYTSFKEELFKEKIAYEGMLYRHNIEQLDTNDLQYDHYVFVGFNVLNKVESLFFEKLRDADRALFYWDYDQFYTSYKGFTHEAGVFINRNLDLFPNQLSPECFNELNKPKKITYISSSTETAQARFLPQWIENNLGEKEKETAVVLCNEALLLPVLHSIPSKVQNLNITMGFPLAQTPICSLIKALMELQNQGYNAKQGYYNYQSILAVLKHPYTRQLSTTAKDLEKTIIDKNMFYLYPSQIKQDDFLEQLFSPQLTTTDFCKYLIQIIELCTPLYRKDEKEENVFDQLYRESLFKAYTLINRIYGLIDSGELPIKISTLKHLIDKVLSSANIPFHGEPAIGMQVMGVLETRNLDFKNLVMLSVNEGQLPKSVSESSFIPYNLRKAFGMTTIEHKNAVYAYYFYRLIQRAENITLIYNTASDGLNKGEISRFMLQLLVEWPHSIERKHIEACHALTTTPDIQFDKTPEVFQKLKERYDISLPNHEKAILSPSALNTYLDCKLKFYYRYIAGLKAPNEVSDEIDAALFGSIFHRAAETIYKDLADRQGWIKKEDIQALLKIKPRIQEHIDNAFKKLFFKIDETQKPEYNGIQLVNSRVICSYIEQLLKHDLEYAPFQIVGMEKTVEEQMTVSTPSGQYSIKIGGNIDRLDLKEGILRIVDYKTGGTAKTPQDISQLFEPAIDRPNYVFQTFLYASIVSNKVKYQVAPSLLYIHRAAAEDYSPVIQMGQPRKEKIAITNFKMVEDEFKNKLQELIKDLFERDICFTQTEFPETCQYCDFKGLCKR
ncbi:PD-(D/E)XK nuclease family protein [Bacteroides coprosuis]|uniref:PD-(D/E)XK nuclease family protein n=1 Tax=Bacteroides coprosuis TaxID=151276 RepID=UPI001D725C32|nr:PD-(D/E)XK nuclease family protein [Bacteroides coprosuis]HJD91549.1 PD-(D/E)XK nuclease family protein [Bacteroides coprosuis]